MLKVFCAILKTAPFFVNCSTSGDNLSDHGCHCCAGQIRKNIVLLLTFQLSTPDKNIEDTVVKDKMPLFWWM